MGRKTFIRVNAESRQNKKGEMTKWEDLEPDASGREYWSEDSVRKRPLEEQYPQLEHENEEEYEARLQVIGKAVLSSGARTHLSNGREYYVDYETTEPSSKSGERVVYHGHRFEELEPDIESFKMYEGLFGETKRERRIRTLRAAMIDSDKARHDESFPPEVSTTRGYYDSQMDIARHYVGALSYFDKTPIKGIFEGFGESRYSDEDKAYMTLVKSGIERSAKQQELTALAIGAKMFEGLFTPFVLQGFFDLSGEAGHAGIIVPSEYDDIAKKVDAAVILPIETLGKDGKTTITRLPICFDLTTGTGDGKVRRITDEFRHRHGFADIKYPSTYTGKAIEPLDDVPHFAICIETANFPGFRENVAFGTPIPLTMQYVINLQLLQQAIIAFDYWSDRPGGEKKARRMKTLALHFEKRVNANAQMIRGIPRSEVERRYASSLRYLDKLK